MTEGQHLVAFRRSALALVALCFIVVVLGAFVRLNAAGLGCPDWPTCYGHITAGAAAENHEAANAAYPDRPVHYAKALKEMVHRYAAMTLGFLILILAIWAYWKRRDPRQPLRLPLILLLVVIAQGVLGMLTVTWLLKPMIVTAHLLGGMTTLSLLWWLSLSPPPLAGEGQGGGKLKILAVIGLIVLAIQIALGGWTSTNYAAVACPDFPACQNSWWPHTDFKDAFVLWRGLGIDYEGGVLDHPARVAIHLTHRFGAAVTTLVLGTLAVLAILKGSRRVRFAGIAVAAALVLQVAIGIGTVKQGFPLPLATAHNGGAALLLLSVVALLRQLCASNGTSKKWRAYWQLTKPRVVALIVFTAIVGMFLATHRLPSGSALVFGTLGIWLAAASAAAINHVLDRRIDAEMMRTRYRPIPTGNVTEVSALLFAFALGLFSMLILALLVNPLTAVLTFASLIGYSVIYTVWLKRATPQNIVIGGAAGAAPPVLGWTAVTGQVDPHALLLFLIIFTWTPPHFWALAIARRDDYAKAGIPMLPVTHGVEFTRLHILLYTILLVLVTLLPYITGMSGLLYLAGAAILNIGFLRYALALKRTGRVELPMRTFRYSVNYLMLLFALLLIDHYI